MDTEVVIADNVSPGDNASRDSAEGKDNVPFYPRSLYLHLGLNNADMASLYVRQNLVFYKYIFVQIQKIWRGYWSRRNRFDFACRKNYFESIQRRNEAIRSSGGILYQIIV